MSELSALRVFISYARRDCTAFAEELLAGLEVAGFDPFLDKHDIAAGEDWEARLGGLISAADTVVFVISPASVASDRCAWEVARAEQLSKRIIPIVAIPVPEADTPEGLRRRNYIFFSEGHSYARGLNDLAKALRIDLEWIREHTRLAEMAGRWRDREQADVLLLRGSELEAAKAWLNGWKAGAPEPTDLHRAFIAQSDIAEINAQNAERKQLEELAASQEARAIALKRLSRRTTIGLIGAGGLTAAAAGFAYWGVRERAGREAAEAQSVERAIAREAARTDIAGQLAAYAAAPGQLAADASSENPNSSPFTHTLLRELEDADTSLQLAVARSFRRIAETSEARQRPYTTTDLNGDLYLRRPSPSRRVKALVVSAVPVGVTHHTNVEADGDRWEAFFSGLQYEVQHLRNATAAEIRSGLEGLAFSPEAAPAAPPSLRGPAAPFVPSRRSETVAPPIQRAGVEFNPSRGSARGEGPADTLSIFVFSGFGMQVSNVEYLGAADTDPRSPQTVQAGGIGLRWLQQQLRTSAAASVLILDTNFRVYLQGT